MLTVRSGFDAYKTPDLTDNIKRELDCAKKGLCDLNVNPESIDTLYRRLETGTSVAEKVENMWDRKFNGSPEEKTVEVISDFWEHKRK